MSASPSPSPLSRRRLLAAVGLTGAAAAAAGLVRTRAVWATSGPSTYTASWSSVDQHPAAPEWFQDAKFGIYYHWGVFSVPAFSNEWYPRSMYIAGSPEYNHHVSVYGDPSVWPYHNFINGARDKAGNWVQFAPKLTSAGGNFDPNDWAQLFLDAGAKFAGPVAEHHDGFSMWNSTVNEWNSVARGPKLDLVGLQRHGPAEVDAESGHRNPINPGGGHPAATGSPPRGTQPRGHGPRIFLASSFVAYLPFCPHLFSGY